MSAVSSSRVGEDVDDRSARVLNEEATNAPRLIGQWVDDLEPALLRSGVRRVDRRRVAEVSPKAGWGSSKPVGGMITCAVRFVGEVRPSAGSSIATSKPSTSV